jgi:hypothetical protein
MMDIKRMEEQMEKLKNNIKNMSRNKKILIFVCIILVIVLVVTVTVVMVKKHSANNKTPVDPIKPVNPDIHGTWEMTQYGTEKYGTLSIPVTNDVVLNIFERNSKGEMINTISRQGTFIDKNTNSYDVVKDGVNVLLLKSDDGEYIRCYDLDTKRMFLFNVKKP